MRGEFVIAVVALAAIALLLPMLPITRAFYITEEATLDDRLGKAETQLSEQAVSYIKHNAKRAIVTSDNTIEEINTFYMARNNPLQMSVQEAAELDDELPGGVNELVEYFLAASIRAVIAKDPQKAAALSADKGDFRVIELEACVFEDDVWPPPCTITKETPGLSCGPDVPRLNLSFEAAWPSQSHPLISSIDYMNAMGQFAESYNLAIYIQKGFPNPDKCTLAADTK